MPQADQTRAREGSSEGLWNSEQRNAILAEAEQILADPCFKNSKRCVALFRGLIEHALESNDEGSIKERTLGIEVFGRRADYDTNADPVVRMTANEIRKRLAQHYLSSSRHCEVQVSLVPGSYLPRFNFESPDVSSSTAPKEPADAEEPGISLDTAPPPPISVEDDTPSHLEKSPRSPVLSRILVAVSISIVIFAIALALNWSNWTDALRPNQYLLWAPLLRTPDPVIISIPDVSMAQLNAGFSNDWASTLADEIRGRIPATDASDTSRPYTSFVDSEVSARVAGWLRQNGKPFRISRASRLTLEDFRRGPVVLVGAFDNVWTLALYSKLRYHFQIDPVTKDEWIEDGQNPENRAWKVSGKLLYSDSSEDYALITRVFNKDTGTWFMTAGGLGLHATEAAGDLLTDPELSRSLPSAVRSGNRNVQIVLKTTVIAGHPGAPQILAVYTW